MAKFFEKHWFLITLVGLLVAGNFFAEPLEFLASASALKWSIVFVTMFLMTWPVSFAHLKSTVGNPIPSLFACALNVGLIPLLVWPVAGWCGPELGPGLLIAAATPSTLASAAVWTRRALGNDGVAILVTIITNGSCFLVLPFWIWLQTGDQIDATRLTGTIYQLLYFVVLPIALAQLARARAGWAQWATANKPRLSLLAMVGVLSIVFLGSISMGLRFSKLETSTADAVLASAPLSATNLGLTGLIVLVVHVSVFWLGLGLGKGLGFSEEDRIGVAFSGSQKTLMIGLSTSISLGFSMIPIIMYHTFQLLIDTVFAEQLRRRRLHWQATADPAAPDQPARGST